MDDAQPLKAPIDQTAQHAARIDKWAKMAIRRFRQDAYGVHPRHCPICGYYGSFVPFGSPPRLDARCGSCGSLERHRQFVLYGSSADVLGPDHRVLHFAPEPALTAFVRARVGTYETADLNPKMNVTHHVNIEDTGLPDASYDRIICNHVLEHVDDAKALSGFFRMLKPGGFAILSTPLIEGWAETYENPDVDGGPDRRLHFGQFDHVRYFGADLRDRIRAAGFTLDEITAVEPDVLTYGLLRGEKLFIARKPKARATKTDKTR